jgi:hypothetical protein
MISKISSRVGARRIFVVRPSTPTPTPTPTSTNTPTPTPTLTSTPTPTPTIVDVNNQLLINPHFDLGTIGWTATGGFGTYSYSSSSQAAVLDSVLYFSYVSRTVSQTVNVSNLITSANSFNGVINIKHRQRGDDGGYTQIDTYSFTIIFRNSSGQTIATKTTGTVNAPQNFTDVTLTLNRSEIPSTFDTITSVVVQITGIDTGFWNGHHGPMVDYVNLEWVELLTPTETPIPTSTPTETPTLTPTNTPTPTPTTTETSTPTPTPTETQITYYYYFLRDCNQTHNKIGRSLTSGLTGIIYSLGNGECYEIVGLDLGPEFDYDLDDLRVVLDCSDVACSTPTPEPTITPTPTPTATPSIPENDFTYVIIPNNDLTYTLIPNNDLVYMLIPNDDLTYTLIPSNDLTHTLIPNNDLLYTLVPDGDLTYVLLPNNDLNPIEIPNNDINYTLIPNTDLTYTLIPNNDLEYSVLKPPTVFFGEITLGEDSVEGTCNCPENECPRFYVMGDGPTFCESNIFVITGGGTFFSGWGTITYGGYYKTVNMDGTNVATYRTDCGTCPATPTPTPTETPTPTPTETPTPTPTPTINPSCDITYNIVPFDMTCDITYNII